MKNIIRRNVPSMFHRRLLLLTAGIVVVFSALTAQMANLTLAQGEKRRAQAESAMVESVLVPTVRGRILDRKGRVLAVDKPSYDVTVEYSVLSGKWSYHRASRDAFLANRARWGELNFDERDALIAECQQPYDAQVESLWHTLCAVGQITRDELEQRKATISSRVQQVAYNVWQRSRERRESSGDPDEEELTGPMREIREQRSAHTLLTGLPTVELLKLQRLIADAKSLTDERGADGKAVLTGIEVWRLVGVENSKEREYPSESIEVNVDRSSFPSPIASQHVEKLVVEGVGTHILGSLRNIWREDVDRRPFTRGNGQNEHDDLGGYLPGDKTGAWGVEKAKEDRLRGKRGRLIEQLDTHLQTSQPPELGHDVTLSIDIQLQARIQAIMNPAMGLMKVQSWNSKDPTVDSLRPQLNEPLNGAAVVLDINTGQVLAAVSMPTFRLEELRDNPETIINDRENQPFLNRVIGQPLQPGSTVKPLVLAAAVTDRKLRADETIECKGHLDENAPDRYRCWIFKQSSGARIHGPLSGSEAIARSCNIFFFTLGRRLGPVGIVQWFDRYGIGRLSNCGLGEEVPGDLPDLARARTPNAPGFTPADAVFLGIGQGPIQWTPLQAANCFATIARGGYFVSPTFYDDPDDSTRTRVDLGLDPRGVDLALRGLSDAVNQSYGTGHHFHNEAREKIFNMPGVQLYGKSGTADAVPLRIDSDGDGKITSRDRIIKEGDHAWMMLLVHRNGRPRPDYAIAVVVEYGGSGGVVAGPVANQVLHALRAEGYL